MATGASKPLVWIGDSRKRLCGFPDEVKDEIGYALYLAQRGESHVRAKRLTGINAVEIVSDYDGDTFRGVYTTKIQGTIYVLHCFQKKSKRGSKTLRSDMDLIAQRLKSAEALSRQQG